MVTHEPNLALEAIETSGPGRSGQRGETPATVAAASA